MRQRAVPAAPCAAGTPARARAAPRARRTDRAGRRAASRPARAPAARPSGSRKPIGEIAGDQDQPAVAQRPALAAPATIAALPGLDRQHEAARQAEARHEQRAVRLPLVDLPAERVLVGRDHVVGIQPQALGEANGEPLRRVERGVRAAAARSEISAGSRHKGTPSRRQYSANDQRGSSSPGYHLPWPKCSRLAGAKRSRSRSDQRRGSGALGGAVGGGVPLRPHRARRCRRRSARRPWSGARRLASSRRSTASPTATIAAHCASL